MVAQGQSNTQDAPPIAGLENGKKAGDADENMDDKADSLPAETGPVMAENGMIPADGVVIKILDKVTARVKPMTIAVGDYRRIGDIFVRPRACQKSDPLETPESAAFLEIWQIDTKRQAEWVFSGWMFASSPAISSMNHPVYDIWVVDCANDVPDFIGPRRPLPTMDGR
jgi:hypothetical protein